MIPMDYIIREYRSDDPEDARKLAKMWNDSDQGWPGGFTQGIPFTQERIADKMKNMDRLAVLVAEYGDEIVGYCDLQAQRGQKDMAYIPLLNVSPAHQGKGVGRRLILAVLARTVELGYKQLTLDTWPSNLQAVPLYKKTGFFWKPDTNVGMHNFVPTALTLPVAREFFARHDWYRCFKRDLEVKPDECEWNGIQVYPYAWEEEGDFFRMIVDKEAESVTAIETPEFSVACILGRDRLATGLQGVARWEIENRTGHPLTGGLIATGDEGISISVQESVAVEKRAILERPYRLDIQTLPPDEDRPSPKIRSTLLIQGMPVTLESGIRPVAPVEIQMNGWGMRLGKREKITVNLKSNLDFPVDGRLLVEPHPALELDRQGGEFHIEPKSWSGMALWGVAKEPGAFYTAMQAVLDKAGDENKALEMGFEAPLRCRPKTVTFRGLPTGKVVASINPELKEAVLESDILTVWVGLRGGWMNIHHRLLDRWMGGQQAGALGPPFVGWHENPPLYPGRIVEEDGQASIILTVPSDDDPRIIVEKTITLSAGPVVKVAWRIINNSEAPFKGKLRVRSSAGLSRRVTIPLKEGLVSEPTDGWGSFPMGDADLSRKTEDYSETWVAWEQEGHAMGLVWQSCEEQEITGFGAEHDFAVPEVAPQSFACLEPFYIITGGSTWEDIRKHWRQLTRPGGIREDRKPKASPVLEVISDPSPLIALADQAQGKLLLYNRRNKVMQGTLSLEAKGLSLSQQAFKLEEIRAGNPFRQEIGIAVSSKTPQAIGIKARVDTGLTTEEKILPFLKLGDIRSAIDISHKDGLYAVNNGWMCFRVAPHFCGSVIALETDGVSHLRSSYPKAGPFVWFNPWHGGLHPLFGHIWGSRVNRETFTGEKVEATGQRGLRWEGVRVICDPQHQDWQWLHLEADYLTLPGSNLMAIRIRGTNKTGAFMGADLGAALWCQPGGSLSEAVLHYEREGKPTRRRRSDYSADLDAGPWAAVENPSTGDILLLVNSSEGGRIEARDMGREGVHPLAQTWLQMNPHETREMLLWLVLTREMDQAGLYRSLQGVWELP